jgi:hypothetical protein
MKKFVYTFLFSFLSLSGFAQQGIAAPVAGRYAGSKKMLINKKYTDSRNIAGLKGWLYLGGSVINSLDDPEMITANVFKRGTTSVIIFSIKKMHRIRHQKNFLLPM